MAIDINIPSQVKTYANLAGFPATGSLKTIFIAEDTNKTYRWTGTAYVEVSAAGATGITIGTTAITSGTVGRVLFEGTGNVVQESANLFWDNTNGRLGIGTSTPSKALTIQANANDEGILLRSATGLPLFQVTRDGASNNTAELFQYANGSIRLAIRSTSNFSYFNGGNFGFGTTTDAGYKLDVNGTARVTGQLSVTSNIVVGSTAGVTAPFFNGATNPFQFGVSSIYLTHTNSVAVASGLRSAFLDTIGWQQSSGTAEFASFRATPTYNTTGTYTGIVRGFHYKPTITSLTGATHYAIHTEAGRVRFENLPTSSAGLSTGDIWNDAGTLKIV